MVMSWCPQVLRPPVLHRKLAVSSSRRYFFSLPGRLQATDSPTTTSPEAPATETVSASVSASSSPLSTSTTISSSATDASAKNVLDNPFAALQAAAEGSTGRAPPFGSRRLRAAVQTSQNIPFEQLPYQCFQEARKILREDRERNVKAIQAQLGRIAWWEQRDADLIPGGEKAKQKKLASMRDYVEELKILADINDPLVRRKFEDGTGDMNKPVYRHLAKEKWRSYPYRILEQRIEQFKIVPDIVPALKPTADVELYFQQKKVSPGTKIDSLVSEKPPRLRAQVFDKGERLVSVAVVDPDVPDLKTDTFFKRCHYLAVNVPLSPSSPSIALSKIKSDTQLVLPWLPPHVPKGSPYHRLAVFVLEQTPGKSLQAKDLRTLYSNAQNPDHIRHSFSVKSFRDKFGLKPIGFNLFRSEWDDNTYGVMQRAGLPGAEIELRRKHFSSLKPPRRPRGWEAKRQGPKYRHVWKYTKRIRGLSSGKRWTKRT